MPNAFECFCEAALVIRELRGTEGYVAMLQQELAREGVIARLTEARRAAFAASQPAVPQSSDQLETAVKALEFYAEGDNHKPVNGKPSAVARDKGRRARQALEAISGEPEDADENEGEE